MAKELFNQAIATIDRAKRLAFGQPYQNGCDNVLISTFQDETRGYRKLGVLTGAATPFTTVDSAIVGINIKYVSGSPSFKLGSTVGAEDLFPSTPITESVRIAVSIECYSRSVYPTVTGTGSVEVTLVLENDIF